MLLSKWFNFELSCKLHIPLIHMLIRGLKCTNGEQVLDLFVMIWVWLICFSIRKACPTTCVMIMRSFNRLYIFGFSWDKSQVYIYDNKSLKMTKARSPKNKNNSKNVYLPLTNEGLIDCWCFTTKQQYFNYIWAMNQGWGRLLSNVIDYTMIRSGINCNRLQHDYS